MSHDQSSSIDDTVAPAAKIAAVEKKDLDKSKRKISRKIMSLLVFPDEVLLHVLSFASNETLFILGQSCHRIHALTSELLQKYHKKDPDEYPDPKRWPLRQTEFARRIEFAEFLLWQRPSESKYICTYAASFGAIDVIEWARKRKCSWGLSTTAAAAGYGDIEKLNRIHAMGCKWDSRMWSEAAKNGHKHVLEFLRSKGVRHDDWTFIRAAEGEHLEILKWLHDIGVPWIAPAGFWSPLTAAAKKGNLEIFQWAYRNGCPFESSDLKYAMENGHGHILKWALENNLSVNRCSGFSLGRMGDIQLLEMFAQRGLAIDGKVIAGAATAGHLDVIKWARAKGATYGHVGQFGGDLNPTSDAACNGHMEVLKWMVGDGCPFDIHVCSYIARFGDLETLEWARELNAPWDSHVFTSASKNGHLHVIKWAFEKGCPLETNSHEMCKVAAQKGYKDIVVWNGDHGCSLREVPVFACYHGDIELLKYVLEKDKSINTEHLAEAAATHGQLEMLQWLVKSGFSWKKHDLKRSACDHGDILRWIDANLDGECSVKAERIQPPRKKKKMAVGFGQKEF